MISFEQKSDKTYKETGMYGSFKETNKIDGMCFWVSPDIGLIRQRLEDEYLKYIQRKTWTREIRNKCMNKMVISKL